MIVEIGGIRDGTEIGTDGGVSDGIDVGIDVGDDRLSGDELGDTIFRDPEKVEGI